MESVVKSTFDTNTKDGMVKAFNASNGSAKSMKDLSPDEVFKVVDILVYTDVITNYGKEEETEITTLFTEDGSLYASVSSTVSKTAKGLIELKENLDVDSLDIQVIKAQSKQGQEFLNLKLAN